VTSAAADAAALAAEVREFQARFARSLAALAGQPPPALATAPREAVLADGKAVLYRYASGTRVAGRPPLLVLWSMVNRPTVLDLEPNRSLIRGLLGAGLDVYLLDWGVPDRGDRERPLADYLLGTLHRAVLAVAERHGAIDLLGVCQGGTFALLYASQEPARLRRLVTMVTPVDFHTPDNLLARWMQGVDVARLVAAFGNVPGELLNAAFVSLMPFRLTLQKYLALVDGADDPRRLETFLRMEQWLRDSPDQPGAAFREFAEAYFQENRLARGVATLGGRPVDLGRITQPLLNVYATEDHLVPPAAARALGPLVGSRAYEELAFAGGHIGLYVGSKAHTVPPSIAAFLGRPERAPRPRRRGR
jgi:polyhydroxyalkanoate synthase